MAVDTSSENLTSSSVPFHNPGFPFFEESTPATANSLIETPGVFQDVLNSSVVHAIEVAGNGAFSFPISGVPIAEAAAVEPDSNFAAIENSTVDSLFPGLDSFPASTSAAPTSASNLISNSADNEATTSQLIEQIVDILSTVFSPTENTNQPTNISTIFQNTNHGSFSNSTTISPDKDYFEDFDNATFDPLQEATTSTESFNLSSILSTIAQTVLNATHLANDNSTVNSTKLEESTMFSTPALVCTVIPLSLLCLFIILGNLLVIVTVFTQKSLRTPQNIYIVSLAAADMTVGILILPINITFMVLGRWFLGHIMCELWLVTDVSLCTVSIFHLCAIAVDRYRAITDGINYVQHRNLKSVLWTILFIWILAFWIGSPPILGWKDLAEDGSPLPYVEGDCMLPTNVGYVFHLATGALFFPLILMSFLYGKIYFAIRERFRERSKFQTMELTSEHDSTTDAHGHSVNGKNSGTASRRPTDRKPSEQMSGFMAARQKFSLTKERKAARTLGIIMGAFIICWLPLGFMNIYTALVPEEYNPSFAAFQIANWLGYVNSGLNPVIYAISNTEFQKGFKRILHLS